MNSRINTHIDFAANVKLANQKEGVLRIGDKALEFSDLYIPWNHIIRIRVVYLHKTIVRIHVDYDKSVLSFSSPGNFSILKRMRRYLSKEQIIWEKTFEQKWFGKA